MLTDDYFATVRRMIAGDVKAVARRPWRPQRSCAAGHKNKWPL